MKYVLTILLLISPSICKNEETCTKEEPCKGTTQKGSEKLKNILGLPGSDAEWVAALQNVKMFVKQIKTSLTELGLGPFLGEIAQLAGLPGTSADWIRMFKDVTMEKVSDSWNEFLFNIRNGKCCHQFCCLRRLLSISS